MNRKSPSLSSSVRMLSLVVAFGVSICRGAPSDNHIHLSEAAKWAVLSSNLTLLKALLQAGFQLNEDVPHEPSGAESLLHFAIRCDAEENLIRFMIDSGAERDQENSQGDRPIDIAYDNARTNICELLATTFADKSEIDTFPKAMLDVAFRCEPVTNRVVVSLNGKPPSGDFVRWLNKERGWGNAVTVDQPAGDIKSDHKCGMAIIKVNDSEYLCRMCVFRGSFGGGWFERRVVHKFGYWVVDERSGGDL